MMIATRHGDTYVKKATNWRERELFRSSSKREDGDGTGSLFRRADPDLKAVPQEKFAVLTTGNEVYYHRIEDTFTPVIQEKLAEFGAEMIFHEVYDDDASKITDGCRRAMEAGADLVFCTGGMSVDPDDKTPLAIKIPEHASFLTARRCCREPCSFWRMPKRNTDRRPAGMRHVFGTDDFRSCPAAPHCR